MKDCKDLLAQQGETLRAVIHVHRLAITTLTAALAGLVGLRIVT